MPKEGFQSATSSKNFFPFTKRHNRCGHRYVDVRSSEREPFISSLQKLRPDLKRTVSELDNHLEVLKDDIADLLGRLRHPRISQELKST